MGTEKLSILKYVLFTLFVGFSQAHFPCLSLCLSPSLSLSLSPSLSLCHSFCRFPLLLLLPHPLIFCIILLSCPPIRSSISPSVYLTARLLTPLSVSTVLSLSVYLFHPFPVSHSSVFLSPSANLSTKIFERFTSAEIRY